MPKKQVNSPISNGYCPEIDVTDIIDPELASYYQSLIGILRWCNELGRVDITAEVSMLSSCMSMPREGHLKQVFMMFAYLERHHNAVLLFDPTPMNFDKEGDFPKQDWSHSIYKTDQSNLKESLPEGLPEPCGKEMDMVIMVDSNHAGDQATRRSCTGFLV